MIRSVLLASLAASALMACTVSNDPYYSSGPSASNPPGWVDRNRDGIDDRTQARSTTNPPGWVDRNGDGIDDRTQGSRYNPNNPPGWVDYNRNGVDDRVEQRRTSYRSGGYYDSYGVWQAY